MRGDPVIAQIRLWFFRGMLLVCIGVALSVALWVWLLANIYGLDIHPTKILAVTEYVWSGTDKTKRLVLQGCFVIGALFTLNLFFAIAVLWVRYGSVHRRGPNLNHHYTH